MDTSVDLEEFLEGIDEETREMIADFCETEENWYVLDYYMQWEGARMTPEHVCDNLPEHVQLDDVENAIKQLFEYGILEKVGEQYRSDTDKDFVVDMNTAHFEASMPDE